MQMGQAKNSTVSPTISIQETNHKIKGKYKNYEFQIFEAIRKNMEKGGIHISVEPVLIEDYSEKCELIVAEIKAAKKDIRIITG